MRPPILFAVSIGDKGDEKPMYYVVATTFREVMDALRDYALDDFEKLRIETVSYGDAEPFLILAYSGEGCVPESEEDEEDARELEIQRIFDGIEDHGEEA